MYNCLLPIAGYLIVRLQGPNCKLLDLRDCILLLSFKHLYFGI